MKFLNSLNCVILYLKIKQPLRVEKNWIKNVFYFLFAAYIVFIFLGYVVGGHGQEHRCTNIHVSPSNSP